MGWESQLSGHGLFPLQHVPRTVMVIRISWYSGEGPVCRIVSQVDHFCSARFFLSIHNSIWHLLARGHSRKVCSGVLVLCYFDVVVFSGVISPCPCITVVFSDVLNAAYSVSVIISTFFASGCFIPVVRCGVLTPECCSPGLFSGVLAVCCHRIAVFSGILSAVYSSTVNFAGFLLFQRYLLDYSPFAVCKK